MAGKLGDGSRFKALTGELSKKKGVYNPKGLAAFIGRKKYGNTKFQGLASAGRRRGRSRNDYNDHDEDD